GESANYSGRAVWTSSNPEVLAVSNGDILIPGSETDAFAGGTLIPKQASDTPVTIRADFVGLSAEIDVMVEALDLATLRTNESSVVVATETSRQLTLTLTVDDQDINLTGDATWAFPEDTEDTA